jgi:hypothetical protein
VTLQAAVAVSQPPAPPVAPLPAPAPEPAARPGFFARMLRRRKPVEAPAAPPPLPQAPPPEPVAPVEAMADDAVLAVLTGVLDTLGRARHRPFSRA